MVPLNESAHRKSLPVEMDLVFRYLPSDTLHEMGYEAYRADNNMWIQPEVKPD